MAYPPTISVSYDPYSYYNFAHNELDTLLHPSDALCASSSSYLSPRPRPASIWSTSSICSDDSSLDLEDRAHDFDDEDALVSPISPAESSSSRTSWSSMASSSSYVNRTSPTERDPSERCKRSSIGKPRGPRPLPTLPTSQPCSPYSTTSSLPPTLPLKSTPPLRLNVKDLTPPPSYEEAMSASPLSSASLPSRNSQTEFRPTRLSKQFPFDAEMDIEESPAVFLTSPSEETIIDWQQIEEFMSRYDG